MNHLETLVGQFYEWKGYFIRRNVLVGRRSAGGWDMELDVVAFHPREKELIHIEASLDAYSWSKREQRFAKKFAAGQKYIRKEVFPWLDAKTELKQQCIVVSRAIDRTQLAGGELLTVDEFMRNIKAEIIKAGIVGKSAIPEQFDLLRTIQLTVSGYYRVL